MTRRRSSPLGLELVMSVTLALVVLPLLSYGAPVQDAHSELQRYSEGCYYNFNHYSEGDRITTNEPCLNCTCHNRMLMCYLRVCPFTKPIGHDCIVEKREDQCCPIITCPEVPVNVSHHSNQLTTHAPGTELSIPEKYGCSIDSKFYPEGALLPVNPNKPCELCYCIRNRTSCLIKECTLHIDGCQPVYNKGSCCPVRYNCDHENELLELEDHSTTTTTVRPTTGFVLSSTSSPAVSTDCIHNSEVYADGASITGKSACEHCYCMRGDIICAVQECEMPTLESGAKTCRALPPVEGECCPSNYICEDDTAHTDFPLIENATTSKVHPDLHESVSQEDVQLQEHIDDKAVVEEIPEKSDEHPDSESPLATDAPVFSKVTQGAIKAQDEYESPVATTTSSIKETTHETTVTPFEFEDAHTVISADKEYDSRPSSTAFTTTAPSSEDTQKETEQSTISSGEEEDKPSSTDATPIVSTEEEGIASAEDVEKPSASDAEEGMQSTEEEERPSATDTTPIAPVGGEGKPSAEEEKPSITDAIQTASVEEESNPSAEEEEKPSATDASVEEESKPLATDTTPIFSIEEEGKPLAERTEKPSATDATPSAPIEKGGKPSAEEEPSVTDATTIASVEEEGKPPAGEEGKPLATDATPVASIEEGDKPLAEGEEKQSTTDATSITSAEEEDQPSAEEKQKPSATDATLIASVEEEGKQSAEEEEESSVTDATPIASVEEEGKPPAGEEGKPLATDATPVASIEEEDKPLAGGEEKQSSTDATPITTVEEEDQPSGEEKQKPSATNATPISSVEEQGKPLAEEEGKLPGTDSTAIPSVKEEGMPSTEEEKITSATDATPVASVDEEGKPSAEEEEKPSATDATPVTSGEEGSKPLDEEKEKEMEQSTISSGEVSEEDKEEKPSAAGEQAKPPAEEEDKPSVTDASVEKGGKPSAEKEEEPSSTYETVEKESKPSAEEEEKPSATDASITISTEGEDKATAFESTAIASAEGKVKPAVSGVPPSTTSLQQEEESTEISPPYKAHVPPEISQEDEGKTSAENEESTGGSKYPDGTTVSPLYETITEGSDSHIVMPEIADHTSHDVEEKIKDELEISTEVPVSPVSTSGIFEQDKKAHVQHAITDSTTTHTEQIEVTTLKPATGDNEVSLPESAIDELRPQSDTESGESAEDDVQKPVASEEGEEIPAIIEEVTKKSSESTPVGEPEVEIEATVVPVKQSETHISKEQSEEEESSSEEKDMQTTISSIKDKEIEKPTTTSPFEVSVSEKESVPSQPKDSIETSSEEDKESEKDLVAHTTLVPSDTISEETSSEEVDDADKQSSLEVTTSAPSNVDTQAPAVEKGEEVKHEEHPSTMKTDVPIIKDEVEELTTIAPSKEQSEEEGSGAPTEDLSPPTGASAESSSEEETISEQPEQGPIDSTTMSPTSDEQSVISSSLPTIIVDTKKPTFEEGATEASPEQESGLYSTISAPSISELVEPTSSEEDTDQDKPESATITPIAIDSKGTTLRDEKPTEQEKLHGLDITTDITLAPESHKPSDEKEINLGQVEDVTIDSTTIASVETEETSSEEKELEVMEPHTDLADATTVSPSVIESKVPGAVEEQSKEEIGEGIPASATIAAPSSEEKEHGISNEAESSTISSTFGEPSSTKFASVPEEEKDEKQQTTVIPSVIDTNKTGSTFDEKQQTFEGDEASRPTTLSPAEESDESSQAEGSGLPIPGIIPPAIPGEGDCLVNGQTYENNDTIPVSNDCEVSCLCVSSIVVCQRVQCYVPPNTNKCILDEASTDKCCPQYICGYDSFTDEQRTTTPEAIDDGEIQFTTLPPPKKYPELFGVTNVEEATTEEEEKPVSTAHEDIEEGGAYSQRPDLTDDSKVTKEPSVIEEGSTKPLLIDDKLPVKDSDEQSFIEGSAEGSEEEGVSTEGQEQLPSATRKPVTDEPVHIPELVITDKPTFVDREEATVTDKGTLGDREVPEHPSSLPEITTTKVQVDEDNIEISTQGIQQGTDKPTAEVEEITTKSPTILGAPKIDESVVKDDNASETSAQTTPSSHPSESELNTDAPSLSSIFDSSEGLDSTESEETPEEEHTEATNLAFGESTTSVPVAQHVTTIKTIQTDLEGEIQPAEPVDTNTIIPEIIYHKPEMPEDMSHTKVEEVIPDTETGKPTQAERDEESSESVENSDSTEKTLDLIPTPKAPVSTVLTPVYSPEEEPEKTASTDIHAKKDESVPTEIKKEQALDQSTEPASIEAVKPIASTIAPGASTAELPSGTSTISSLIEEQPIAGTISPVPKDKIEQPTSAPPAQENPLPDREIIGADISKEDEELTHATSTPSITDVDVTTSSEEVIATDSEEAIHPGKPSQEEELSIPTPTNVLPGGQVIYEQTTRSPINEEDKEVVTGSPSSESTTQSPDIQVVSEEQFVTLIPVKQGEESSITTKPVESFEPEDSLATTKQPHITESSIGEESSEISPVEEEKEEKEGPHIAPEDKQPVDKTLLTTESPLPESETSRPLSGTEEQAEEQSPVKPEGEVPLSEIATSTPIKSDDEGSSTEFIQAQPSAETAKPTLSKDDQSIEDGTTVSSRSEDEEYTTKQPSIELSQPVVSKDELPIGDHVASHEENTQQTSKPDSADSGERTEAPVHEIQPSLEEKTEIPMPFENPDTEIPLIDKESEEKIEEPLTEEKTEVPSSVADSISEEQAEKTERPLFVQEAEKPGTPSTEEKTESPLLVDQPSTEIHPIDKEVQTPTSETHVPEAQEHTLAPVIRPDEEQSTEELSTEVPSVEVPLAPEPDELDEKEIAKTVSPVDNEQAVTYAPPKLPTVSDVSEELPKEGAKKPSQQSSDDITTEVAEEATTVISTQAPHKLEEEPLSTTVDETSTTSPKDKEVTDKSEEGVVAIEEPVEQIEHKIDTDLPKPIVTESESGTEDETPLVTSTAHPLFPHPDLDHTTTRPVHNATEKQEIESRPTPTTAQPITSAPTSHYQPPSYGHVPPQYPSYPEDEYTEEDETEIFGPGTCRYGGKLFVSAQQIPRDDPCDFCFCFRSDIICLQQSCPPPISGCHEEPISGFCCPRYECPVSMATVLNITTSTTTTSTTLPPHFLHHAYRGAAEKNGCHINGKSYKVGEPIDSASGPCMHCTCGGDGQMKCDPKTCSPEPMLRQMIAVVASRRR